MNFQRFLPFIISVLAVFVILASWKLTSKQSGPDALFPGNGTEEHGVVRGEIDPQARPSGFYADYDLMGKEAAANASSSSSASLAGEDGPEDGREEAAESAQPGPQPEPAEAEPASGSTQATPTPAPKSQPAPKPKPAPATPADVARVFVDGYSEDRTSFQARITADADIPSCTWFTLEAPRRIVVDVRGRWNNPDDPIYRTGPGVVEKVVVGEHPDRLRLVLHLAKGAEFPDFTVSKDDATVTIRVQNPSQQ